MGLAGVSSLDTPRRMSGTWRIETYGSSHLGRRGGSAVSEFNYYVDAGRHAASDVSAETP
jgi:hypothetical protein